MYNIFNVIMISDSNINKILTKYPTKTPIIVKMDDGKLHKLLLESSSTFDCVIHHVRMNKLLNSRQALFFFLENRILTGQDIISELLKTNDKKYLDIVCKTENTFGGLY